MTDLRHLLEELRRGERPPLSVDDVELLLGWLTGSAARDGEPGDALPQPGHDPVLLQMVLHRLDDVLFDGGELKPAAAGLDPEAPATRRRIRFRRLASAFHPDRFPELADWLTQRSQAVHRAYARFKQDPEAPAVAPPRAPGPVGRNVGPAAPRVRKHRFRAFANQLRARFGNDRYLAHKLIGGLAVLALLPVLNMVLVPSPSAGERAGSAVSLSDPVDAERSVSDANSPTTKRSTGVGVGAGPAGDSRSPDSDSLARQAPTPVASPEADDASAGAASSRDQSARNAPPTEPATNNQQRPAGRQANQETGQPVSDAGAGPAGDSRSPDSDSLARQAPTRVDGSDPAEDANPAPALSTGAGAGPAGEEPSPEARMAAAPGDAAEPDASAREPETGNRKPPEPDPEVSPLLAAARRAMNPNGEIATVAGLQTVDEQLAEMGLDDDTERLYRRIGSKEESDDGRRSTADAGEGEKPVSGFRVPVSGEDPDGATADSEAGSLEAASSRDEAPDSQSLARQAPTAVADSGAGDNPQTGSEPSTVVGAGPAGDEEDPETRSLARQAPTRVDGSDPAEDANPAPALSTGAGAGPAGDEEDPETRSLARQAPTAVADSGAGDNPQTGSEPSTVVGAGPAGDDRGPESRIAAVPTEAAEPGRPARKPESGNRKPAPLAPSAQDAPPTTSQPANQPTSEPAPSAQIDSDLVLGPLGRHPAGEVLQRFHAALQAGNIAGVAGSFAPDARMDSLRGRNEIAEHFRTGLDSVESRRVKLKVRRLGRDDDGWRVQADLDVRVKRDGVGHRLVTGRSNFWLAERGDRLLITRMEPE